MALACASWSVNESMLGLFRSKAREAQISRLYDQILAQARDPSLYVAGRVPDTVEGRTDMMLLHLFLLMHRLNDETGDINAVARDLCDRFFAELDRAMREMGVSDLAVPKRMRKIADIYAGCASSYGKALGSPDDKELAEALMRNVHARREDRRKQAGLLADYVRRASAALAKRPAEELVNGAIPFPSPSLMPTSDP
ncbi:ubiquinol-cytochrome C chaperone family protein [Labrys monachus]|uniref:Cytochrome b pre-mRNA-processing protein 3 n=1 Tax=Labrys monachus TaxID=217067 RepID=A0ABU0FFE8_9HYPH|nr:ubiquinol-cytochrome C chaperone family protein [Labrys monachus]MDQ0393246.1 cytochrome b pre-mRNA-processing protein 3 [Labrys monachus]